MFRLTLAAALAALLAACDGGSTFVLDDGAGQPGDDGSAPPPAACTRPATIGQPFVASGGDQSDPLFAPALVRDGCADTASSWSGNRGESLLLDAGAAQPMQGIHLWMSYARAEWLSIEQSADGQNWTRHWRRVQNLADADSTYFGLDTSQLVRYVRVTGYGSEQNAWTNIAEARWSASGEAPGEQRVWRHSENLVALHSGDERGASPHLWAPLASMFMACPYVGDPVYVDATGQLPEFWAAQRVGDVWVYRFDWAQYPTTDEPDLVGAPAITYEPMRHAQALLEPLAAADPLLVMPTDCGAGTASDALHLVDDMLAQARAGSISTAPWH